MSKLINLDQKNILVVEDDDINFIYLNQIFKLTKGDITRAKSGKEALRLANENNYDLILMDIQLPDISGIDVTKEIRINDSEMPIIAQTAARTPEEIDEILDAGCSSILLKPFKIDQFSSILEEVL